MQNLAELNAKHYIEWKRMSGKKVRRIDNQNVNVCQTDAKPHVADIKLQMDRMTFMENIMHINR